MHIRAVITLKKNVNTIDNDLHLRYSARDIYFSLATKKHRQKNQDINTSLNPAWSTNRIK